MNNRRVFILNDGGQNYQPAEKFGELIYCTEGKLDKFDISNMYRELSETLADSEPHDYIVLTSLSSLCSVACAMMGSMHGELHLLVYDVKTSEYVARDLML